LFKGRKNKKKGPWLAFVFMFIENIINQFIKGLKTYGFLLTLRVKVK